MKNFLKISLFLSACAFMVSCETTELELLENPNSINVESADPDFVLNQVLLDFNGIIRGYSGTNQVITRMQNMFQTYNSNVGNTTGSGEWNASYRLFANIDFLETVIATNELDLPHHLGVAKVLEAYSYFLLVDHFGEVPFSQAVQPEEFPNPVADDGGVVYAAQLELLDEAIALLNQDPTASPSDLYFDGVFSEDNWIALANTLKIRAYLNQRLVDPSGAAAGINGVLGSNIIDTVDEDFEFVYNSNQPNPVFASDYSNTVDSYRSNNYYDFLNAGDAEGIFIETGIPDPRLRYYLYRQVDEDPSGSNLPCEGDNLYDYCYVGNFYWGRDHGDGEGLPNDGARKTARGLYPFGGAFDNNAFIRSRDITNTRGGEGVTPIYLSSFTHFALAEAGVTLGTGGGSPASLLEQGIRLSMEKVRAYADGLDTVDPDTGEDYAMTNAEINDYVARVITEFNGANNDGKVAIIAREFFLASWGNGIEPYNNYRRTGAPDLQEPIVESGLFPRTWRYPITEVDNNPNINQTNPSDRTFWDNNPAGFID